MPCNSPHAVKVQGPEGPVSPQPALSVPLTRASPEANKAILTHSHRDGVVRVHTLIVIAN